MKTLSFTLIIGLLVLHLACTHKNQDVIGNENQKPSGSMVFDKTKWKIKDGSVYIYRIKMIDDIVYNDTIRTLSKDQIINLFGVPERNKENHLYYLVSQKKLGFWVLNSKFLVFKFKENNTIEWVKIYG